MERRFGAVPHRSDVCVLVSPTTRECLILRMIDRGSFILLPEGTSSLRYLCAGMFILPATWNCLILRMIDSGGSLSLPEGT